MYCSNLFTFRAKAPISSASLREAILIFLKDLSFILKVVSDVNGVQTPPKTASLSLHPLFHTLDRGYKSV